MRKALLVLKHVVSTTVWMAVVLYLLAIVLTHVPPVQRLMGSKVADMVARKLGTHVDVGRIDLGFFNRIIIDDISIDDQQQRPMLRASRLAVKVDLLPLTRGRISISSLQLFGAHVRLFQADSLSAPNYQFVVDALASGDTTSQSTLDFRLGTLIVRRSSVSYDRADIAPTPARLNPHHIHLTDISTQMAVRQLSHDSLNVSLRRLSFYEQSGLRLDNLALQLVASRRQALLTGLCLQLPDSRLCLDSLRATYTLPAHDAKSQSPSDIVFAGTVDSSYVTPSDLRALMPQLKNYQRPITLSAAFAGTDNTLDVSHLSIGSASGDVALEAHGQASRLDSLPLFSATVERAVLSDRFVDFLSKSFSQLPPAVRRMGRVALSGTASRHADGALTTAASVVADVGQLDLQLRYGSDHRFSGTLATQALQLGRLLDNDQLGLLSANVVVDGQWPTAKTPSTVRRGLATPTPQSPVVHVAGEVARIDYKGYPFSGIAVDASYASDLVDGRLTIDDPNLVADVSGELHGSNSVRLSANVSRIAPQPLHLTDLWGSAHFSGQLSADVAGSSLNDAQGTITIVDLAKTAATDGKRPSGHYHLSHLHLASRLDEGCRTVTLESDFAQATLKGHFDFLTLPQTMANVVGERLSALPGLPTNRKPTGNSFDLALSLSRGDALEALYPVGLSIDSELQLNASVDDRTSLLALDLSAPAFTFRGTAYRDAQLHLTTRTPISVPDGISVGDSAAARQARRVPGGFPAGKPDTLHCQAALGRLTADNKLQRITLQAHALDNNMATMLTWDTGNTLKPMNGKLSALATLSRDSHGHTAAHLRMLPSVATVGPSQWQIAPAEIDYTDNRLDVKHFTIYDDHHAITIDGTASDSPNDTLTATLERIDVDYILQLVGFHAVAFGGEATGRATLTRLFSQPTATASLRVDGFTFEHGRMGTLNADVAWNNSERQVDIRAVANDGPQAQTLINGYVSPAKDYIDLGITAKGTYIDFLHKYTQAFMSSLTGHAQGALRVAGPLSEINLTGKLTVDGQTTITPLGTTYELRQANVLFVPDDIVIDHVPFYDRNGTRGLLTGGVHHEHLTKLTFDLHIDADNLLCYDFKDFGSQSFHGTVYATGTADLQGRPGRVTIDCNVTPQKNTVFTYNAAQTASSGSYDYITWSTVDTVATPVADPVAASVPGGFAAGMPAPPIAPTSTDLLFNLTINATTDAALRLLMDQKSGDYITLYGDGSLRATYYNKGAFQLFGTYTVDHGTYGITIQNILQKHFTFQPGGTIVFGGDPNDAGIALKAVHTVQGVSLSDLSIGNTFSSSTIRVNCIMNIGGQPRAPQVSFDLEMPTVNADEQQMIRSVINGEQAMNQQVLYLLGIGRFYSQGQNNAADNAQDPTALAMQSFLSGTLSSQLNQLLSQVIKSDTWNIGANISTGTEGWNNAEYEGTVNGRMLNNRLLINGQFGYRDRATQASPSFIGDFDIRYLLYPNGNLALKVYNQTNDRYFTRSSLNTQGIGLIMKRDFNGLGDLFGRKKKKKKK